jgi:hypothetical protein
MLSLHAKGMQMGGLPFLTDSVGNLGHVFVVSELDRVSQGREVVHDPRVCFVAKSL